MGKSPLRCHLWVLPVPAVLLRLLVVCYLFPFIAAAQRNAPAGLAIEALQLQALDRDRTVALTWEAWVPGPQPQHGTLFFERSNDGQSWQRIGDQPFWFRPRSAKQLFRFQHPLDLRFRHYRLTVRDSRHRLTHHLLPPLQLANALLYAQHRVDSSQRSVHLTYALERRKDLLLRVFDRIGQQVDTRAIPAGQPGSYSYDLDYSHLPSGTYLLVITQVEDNLDTASLRVEL